MGHDEGISNRSANRPFAEVVMARFSRRSLLVGGLATTAMAFLSGVLADLPAAPGRRSHQGLLGFTPVGPFTADAVVVPAGYVTQVLVPWGDPIAPAGPAFVEDASNSAAEQAHQLGMGHDGMHFFPLGRATARDHGLLVVNHESTSHQLLFPDGEAAWDAEKTAKSQHAHGLSVVEIAEVNGWWQVVDSGLSRRITARTPHVV